MNEVYDYFPITIVAMTSFVLTWIGITFRSILIPLRSVLSIAVTLYVLRTTSAAVCFAVLILLLSFFFCEVGRYFTEGLYKETLRICYCIVLLSFKKELKWPFEPPTPQTKLLRLWHRCVGLP